MRKLIVLAAFALVASAGAAHGQEKVGAGRFDVTLAPLGGMFFTESSTKGEPPFSDFALAGSLTIHLNPRVALEGEVANAIGIRQDITTPEGRVLRNQSSPSLFGYTASVAVHPRGSNHALVPYVAGGVGGITLRASDKVKSLGIDTNHTYLTGNIGGGLKWFAHQRWGLRAEYRLFAVRGTATAPAFFGQEQVRYGHRVYGGVLLNY